MRTAKIMRYDAFAEALNVGLQDSPALKMSKQALNNSEKFLADYKKFKDRLTQVYTSVNPKDGKPQFDDETLKAEVEKILGKEDAIKTGNRNPYLQELTTVLELERRLKSLQDKDNDDRLAEEDLRQQMSDEQDPNTKKELQTRVDKLKERDSETGSEISRITTELNDRKKEFDTKMSKALGEIKKAVARIKNQSLK